MTNQALLASFGEARFFRSIWLPRAVIHGPSSPSSSTFRMSRWLVLQMVVLVAELRTQLCDASFDIQIVVSWVGLSCRLSHRGG